MVATTRSQIRAHLPRIASAFSESSLLRNYDPALGSPLLEDDVDGFDDLHLRICLTVHDHFVFCFLGSANVEVVLLRKPVVPAAIPGGEQISLILPRSGELRAAQCLDVEVSFGVRISAQINLSVGICI